jgi:hypothetical protein
MLSSSVYWPTLALLDELVPAGRLRVVLHDRLAKEPGEVMRGVARWMGVANPGVVLRMEREAKARGDHPGPRLHEEGREEPSDRMLKELPKGKMLLELRSRHHDSGYPMGPRDEEAEGMLREFYAPRNQILCAQLPKLGIDLEELGNTEWLECK